MKTKENKMKKKKEETISNEEMTIDLPKSIFDYINIFINSLRKLSISPLPIKKHIQKDCKFINYATSFKH